ncbi:MAG: metallophosphoesterase [candidate division NC10 bacterium]
MSDIHGFHAVYRAIPDLARAHGVELVILAGDLLGYPDGYSNIQEAQRADAKLILETLQPLQIPVLYIMGNDDWIDLDPPGDPFKSIHGRRIDIGSFNFVGYQHTLPFMGGINEKPEEEIARDLELLVRLMDARTVLVTHGPAFGILDLGILDQHAGSASILTAVDRRSVRAHIHGHIHRCFGRQDLHFNVAAAGRLRGMVIDLSTMRHDVFSGNISGGEE